jgi:hypothetical protein
MKTTAAPKGAKSRKRAPGARPTPTVKPSSIPATPSFDQEPWLVRPVPEPPEIKCYQLEVFEYLSASPDIGENIMEIELLPQFFSQFLLACPKLGLSAVQVLSDAAREAMIEVLRQAEPEPLEAAAPASGQRAVMLTFSKEELDAMTGFLEAQCPLLPLEIYLEALAKNDIEQHLEDTDEDLIRGRISEALERSTEVAHEARIQMLREAGKAVAS